MAHTQIQVRRDIEADWLSADPTLALGELGYVVDTNEVVVGDGLTAFSGLSRMVVDGGAYVDAPTGLGTSTGLLAGDGAGGVELVGRDTYGRATTLDVRDYGATLDGSTDDRAAVLAALADLPADGGRVVISGGACYISDGIDLSTSYQEVFFAADAEVIVPSGFTGTAFRFFTDATVGTSVKYAKVLGSGRISELAPTSKAWTAFEFHADTHGIGHCEVGGLHVEAPHTLFKFYWANNGWANANIADKTRCHWPTIGWDYEVDGAGFNNSWLSRNTFRGVDIQGSSSTTDYGIREDPGWANEYLHCQLWDASNAVSTLASTAVNTTIIGGYGLATRLTGGRRNRFLQLDELTVVPTDDLPVLYLPGTSGNYVSTPDHADLDITGDIDIEVDVALDDYTPSSGQVLAARYVSSSDDRSVLFQILASGALRLDWSPDGTSGALLSEQSTVGVGLTGGDRHRLRATLDVDNGSGGYDVKFYVDDEQIGTTQTGGITTSVYAAAVPLEVGTANAGTFQPVAGKVFRATVKDGIDGTIAADLRCDRGAVGPRYQDSAGKVWTFNGSGWSWTER